MQEMTPSGEDHRKPLAVRGFDDLVVAHGAAGLDDGGYAGFGQRLHAVGEGEEGVAGGDGPSRPLGGLLYRYLGGVDPAHLASPDTHRGPFPGEDYGVALYDTGHAPGEEEVFHLLLRRPRFGDHPVIGVVLDGVRVLEQDAARYLFWSRERADEVCDENSYVRFWERGLPAPPR